MKKKSSKKVNKLKKVLAEYRSGDLHSGSKDGPLVKNPKQAIAIALNSSKKLKTKKKKAPVKSKPYKKKKKK